MADKKSKKEKKATPKGAVEVDEKDLDQAEGGSFSWGATNLQQKVTPVAAGPGAGPHVAPSDATKTILP